MKSVKNEQIELGTASFVAMTYNLWGVHHLERRVDALRALFTLRPADLLGVQELSPQVKDLLDETLVGFSSIGDEAGEGWRMRSNIWWRTSMFELIEYGFEDVGMLVPHAGLYWVRLRPLMADAPEEIVFSTAHLTFQRHPQEMADGINRRVPQAKRIVAELARIAGDVPTIFTADINDTAVAQLQFGLDGYLNSFTALGRHTPSTHPVGAAASLGDIWSETSPISGVGKGIDVLFSKGGIAARSTEVVDFFHDGQVPSDHHPVVATYTFTRPAPAA